MPQLYIDAVQAPPEIKEQLLSLSRDIQFEREITKGGNGYLYFGKNKILNTRVAVKFYYWGGETKFHAEPSALAKIQSPHVLNVQNAGLINGEWAYFVTPYCENGDMDDVIGRTEIGNIRALELTCQLLMGLGTLHEKRYLHRDLKPANIYVGNEGQAIIGDFGSIKRLPIGHDTIPASCHAVLYRPPESIESNAYGFQGDVYQSGIVLYQLLGGRLPYDEASWIPKSERTYYHQLNTAADKSIFADLCVKRAVSRGAIFDFCSLKPWVPECLKRIVRKAAHVDPKKRFQTASSMHMQLNNVQKSVPDWIVEKGIPTLRGPRSYRINHVRGKPLIEKRTLAGKWRRDNTIIAEPLERAVSEINAKR